MAQQVDLERRVEELEQKLTRMRGWPRRGVRWASAAALGDIPLVSIALGPDPAKGEWRGHARGVIAIGDIATGLVAIGGLATGGVCIGGLAIGVASLGGLALGLLLAIGGLAVGGTAVGGAAAGRTAIGGAAAGQYACGGAGFGSHVIDATHADPEAVAFFRERGLDALCPPQSSRRRWPGGARP